jgi:glutamine phosphoribosylpyrophosphate amidotransferase
MKQIEEMVLKIHKKRDGAKLATLENTKAPFIEVKIEDNVTAIVAKEVTETKMKLHTILNNKAYINDSWYNLNDTIMGYTLKYMGKRGVVLKDDNGIRKLFLRENNNNFLMTSEGE